jgi:hypothetical protein
MTSDFVSTMKKLDGDLLEDDNNLDNFYMEDGVEDEGMDFFQVDYSAFESGENNGDAQPSSLE